MFSKRVVPFYTIPVTYMSSSCSISSPAFGVVSLVNFSHSYQYKENKNFFLVYNCNRNFKNYIIQITINIYNLGISELAYFLVNIKNYHLYKL